MSYARANTNNPLGYRPWGSRLNGLGALGASGKILTPGQIFTFQFQNIGYGKPDLSTLQSALVAGGYDVRGVQWTGGIFGLFGNTLQVQILGAGGDADTVGAAMAQLLSSWDTSIVGSFVYQGASGPFWTPGTSQSNQAAGTPTSTGIAPSTPAPGVSDWWSSIFGGNSGGPSAMTLGTAALYTGLGILAIILVKDIA